MSRLPIRVIARLDVKNNTVVKGIHLEGLRVVGNPVELAVDYYQQGADEILYMDAVASLYERNSLLPIVKETAKSVFIPMTVGGGIRTLDNIRDVLHAGADKVAINTAAIKRPEFIREASRKYGAQCIVVSIEAKKLGNHWEAYIDTGREATGVDAIEWAQKAVSLGAGELLITSIDHEGMKRGYDLDLIYDIARKVDVPIIACGGAGKSQDLVDVVQKGHADAVACASLFHYKLASIADVKKDLNQSQILVRCA